MAVVFLDQYQASYEMEKAIERLSDSSPIRFTRDKWASPSNQIGQVVLRARVRIFKSLKIYLLSLFFLFNVFQFLLIVR